MSARPRRRSGERGVAGAFTDTSPTAHLLVLLRENVRRWSGDAAHRGSEKAQNWYEEAPYCVSSLPPLRPPRASSTPRLSTPRTPHSPAPTPPSPPSPPTPTAPVAATEDPALRPAPKSPLEHPPAGLPSPDPPPAPSADPPPSLPPSAPTPTPSLLPAPTSPPPAPSPAQSPAPPPAAARPLSPLPHTASLPSLAPTLAPTPTPLPPAPASAHPPPPPSLLPSSPRNTDRTKGRRGRRASVTGLPSDEAPDAHGPFPRAVTPLAQFAPAAPQQRERERELRRESERERVPARPLGRSRSTSARGRRKGASPNASPRFGRGGRKRAGSVGAPTQSTRRSSGAASSSSRRRRRARRGRGGAAAAGRDGVPCTAAFERDDLPPIGQSVLGLLNDGSWHVGHVIVHHESKQRVLIAFSDGETRKWLAVERIILTPSPAEQAAFKAHFLAERAAADAAAASHVRAASADAPTALPPAPPSPTTLPPSPPSPAAKPGIGSADTPPFQPGPRVVYYPVPVPVPVLVPYTHVPQ